jgi:hypothetical protein
MSQITRRTIVAHQSTEDTRGAPRRVPRSNAGRLARRTRGFGAAETPGSHQGRGGFDKGTLAAAHIGLRQAGPKGSPIAGKRTGRRPLSNPPLRRSIS